MTAAPRWKLFSCYICAWSMVISTPLSSCSITYSISLRSRAGIRSPSYHFHRLPSSSLRPSGLPTRTMWYIYVRPPATGRLTRQLLTTHAAGVCGDDACIVPDRLPADQICLLVQHLGVGTRYRRAAHHDGPSPGQGGAEHQLRAGHLHARVQPDGLAGGLGVLHAAPLAHVDTFWVRLLRDVRGDVVRCGARSAPRDGLEQLEFRVSQVHYLISLALCTTNIDSLTGNTLRQPIGVLIGQVLGLTGSVVLLRCLPNGVRSCVCSSSPMAHSRTPYTKRYPFLRRRTRQMDPLVSPFLN